MSAAVRHCTPRTAHDSTQGCGDAGPCYGAVGDMTRTLTVVVLSVALEVRRQLLVLGSVQVHEAVSNTGSCPSGLGLRRGRSAHAPGGSSRFSAPLSAVLSPAQVLSVLQVSQIGLPTVLSPGIRTHPSTAPHHTLRPPRRILGRSRQTGRKRT